MVHGGRALPTQAPQPPVISPAQPGDARPQVVPQYNMWYPSTSSKTGNTRISTVLNMSHYNPEFASKPDEATETHLLRTNDWMDMHFGW